MKKIFLFILFTSLLGGAAAQTKAAFIRAGETAMRKQDFFSAMNYFEEALEFPGSETAIRYQYGEAARQFFAYDLAIRQYQLVLLDKKADRFPLTEFWLALAYQSTGQYQKAVEGFSNFIENSSNQIYKDRAVSARRDCEWALSMVRNPHDLEVIHLDKKVNTPYSEFGAVQRGDTLYYSSYRYQMTRDQNIPRRRTTKVLTQTGTAKGRPITHKFNENDKLTAHTSLTPDGQRIYYTLCQYTDEVNIRCQIYYRDMGKRKRWGSAQKLPDAINQEGFTATHPAWGIDPDTQKPVLYFSSDRPGGKGGMDIYQVKITDNGFGTPVNLTTINTGEDEITPFYHQKSQSLFFSSTGYQSLGGHDIYQSNHDGEEWKVPRHTGYPLNSSYNDIYFTLSADSTLAYISSNRSGSYYLEEKNKACCNDIFMVKINPPLPAVPAVQEKDTTPLVMIPPVVPTLEDTNQIVSTPPVVFPPEKPVRPSIPSTPSIKPPVASIPPPVTTTVDIETLKSVLPLPLYFHNDQPDARSYLETTTTSYQTTYDDYVQRRDEYLDAVSDADRERVREFFEQDLENGYAVFLEFLEGVKGQLENGKKITLTLQGFTSPRAQSGYNLALGKRRTAAIINFLRDYQRGILNPYLNRGQLNISEKTFGETTAPATVSDLLDDRINSIYVPAAARERRVELVDIRVE